MVLALLYRSQSVQVPEGGSRRAAYSQRVECEPVARVNIWKVLQGSSDYDIDDITVA